MIRPNPEQTTLRSDAMRASRFTAECGLVDHRHPAGRKRSRLGQIVLMEAHAGISEETDATQLGVELRLGQKALRLAGELREHERLAGYRRRLGWEGISGEREHEESRAGFRHPRPFLECPPELRGGTREIPDAMRDDKIEAAVARRNALHWRENDMNSAAESMLMRAIHGGSQHRPRQVDADDVPPQPRERERVAPCAAADVEQAPATGALQLLLRECHEHGVWWRLRESLDRAGSTPLRASERIHTRTLARVPIPPRIEDDHVRSLHADSI
jgi:hypothetical protein